jgi:fructokinase
MENNLTIAGIGEVLFDLLPMGKQLGGAPANFVFHARRLGLEAYAASAVGKDTNGLEICDKLPSAGLSAEYIQQVAYPTGTVQVLLDTDGVPHYTIMENVAWDHIQWTDELSTLAMKADAVCFGSLAQRSMRSCQSIQQFLHHTQDVCLRIFDINLRQHYYSRDIIETSLQAANVLKLNDDELKILQDLLELPESPENALYALRDRYELRYIALTLGAKGSVMMDAENRCDCPGFPVAVKDTVGAGDSFTASMAYGILHNLPLEKINRMANKVAAYICSQAGATPVLPDCLIAELKQDI